MSATETRYAQIKSEALIYYNLGMWKVSQLRDGTKVQHWVGPQTTEYEKLNKLHSQDSSVLYIETAFLITVQDTLK